VTPLTFWLGRGAATVGAVALVGAVLALFGDADGIGRVAFRKYKADFDRRLKFLRSDTRGVQVFWGQVTTSIVLLAIAATRGPWLVGLLVPLVIIAPNVVLDGRVARRIAKVEEQLDAWLGAVANALKASASLGEAIAASAGLVPAPMSEEVAVITREYELGTALDEALQHFSERIPSKTIAGAVLALTVARRSGGNLPEMLENTAAALRELARLEGVVRTKTAEGKAQALVVSAIPIPMVLGISYLDPNFFTPLTRSFVGELVIAGASALWVVAILMAKKILAVDV
jgi:tight adherence protein B